MSSIIGNAEPVDPDAVLEAYVLRVSRAYRDRLAAAYEDPGAAYASFRDMANSRGLGEAAIQMRETPEAFGHVLDGGAEHAQEAARLGARAYHARYAQSNPTLAASVLDEALSDALGNVAGEAAVPRLRGAWDELSAAYGPERGAGVLRRRAGDFAGCDVAPETAARIAEIAAARDYLRERLGQVQRPEYERAAPLPRSLDDERSAPERLPERQQARIVAASDGMRARLAAGYEHPLVAEARLHSLVNQQGFAGIGAAERDPTLLGELRADRPGGIADSAEFARAGLAYSRIAYQYHTARLPDRAAELDAREALESVSRSARDPERAMKGLQEAIQLHGSELEAHLERSRPVRVQRRGPERGGPGAGGVDLPDGDERAAPTGWDRPADDPAVDEAVRAFIAMEEAREETARGRTLREERSRAETVLERLDQQDRALNRARRDFKAAAERVYHNPDAAMIAWEKLVHREKGNLDAAREKVAKEPALLGALRSEVYATWWGKAATFVGVANTQPARDEVPGMLKRAVAHTKAEREVTNPVEWTPAEGKTVHGRENVRAAARGIVRDRTDDIEAADGKIEKLGGVTGAERDAQRSYDGLSPAQQSRAGTKLAATRAEKGRSEASLPTGLLGRSLRAAKVARDLGEGPAGL